MMFGVTGTALATNRVSVIPVKPSKSIYKVITADWFWALCIVLGAVVIPSPKPDASTVLGLPKLCLIRNITGIACPGCGMTRSLIASAHLHLEDAITFHPLGPVVLVLLITYSAVNIRRLWIGSIKTGYYKPIPRIVPITLAICFALIWLARILGFIPTPS